MKWNLILTLISFTFAQKIYSQGELDRYLAVNDSLQKRADSIIASGTYDTIVNNIKYKKISCYSPDMFHHNHYYGKLQFKDGKLDGEYFEVDTKCEPCYLYDYRHNGAIYTEGVYKGEECSMGYTIRYYSNGQINFTYNIAPYENEIGCPGIIDGKETYYDRYGDSLYSQYWNLGKLLKQTPYQVNKSGDVKFQIEGRTLLINDTIKLSEFEKIKLFPDTIKNPELASGYNVKFHVEQTYPHKHKNFKKLFNSTCRMDNLRNFNDKEFAVCLKKYLHLKKNMNLIIFIDHSDRNEMFEPHFLTLVEWREKHAHNKKD